MSKMSDMAMTIEELRTAAAAIKDAADWLAQQFSGEAPESVAETPAPKPEAKPAYTLEQVRAVLADKSRTGHTAKVRTLLQKYGADRGSDFAAEGTDAHTLGEYKIRRALGQTVKDPTEHLTWYSEEMEDCATGYAAYVLEQVEAA